MGNEVFSVENAGYYDNTTSSRVIGKCCAGFYDYFIVVLFFLAF